MRVPESILKHMPGLNPKEKAILKERLEKAHKAQQPSLPRRLPKP